MSCCKNKNFPKIGDLKHTIKIIDKDLVPIDCTVDFDLTDKLSTRAKIKNANSKDRKIFDDTNEGISITHIFSIRYTNAIEADDNILYDSRYFTIQGYEDIDEEKRFLKIFVTERGVDTNKRNLL